MILRIRRLRAELWQDEHDVPWGGGNSRLESDIINTVMEVSVDDGGSHRCE